MHIINIAFSLFFFVAVNFVLIITLLIIQMVIVTAVLL